MKARVVLGVGGGIAAYKACELLRRIQDDGCDVRVIPTESALRFVGTATWEALSGHSASTSVWDNVHEVPHVRLGQEAALVVVAPATADLLARCAHGFADDLLTSTLLTARCPVVLAPAMHTEMWEHPATRANVATLRSRGVLVLDPASGRLTGPDSGPGRLPEPQALAGTARAVLARALAGQEPIAAADRLDLTGRTILVSAGGTHEPLDPVRYLGNRSSGLQGWALADAAISRGAQVHVVAGNVRLPDPAGARVVRVNTAAEMCDAMLDAAPRADAIAMAAAVADFRPMHRSDAKIKKDESGQPPPPVELERNPDILEQLVARRAASGRPSGQVIVGFAAETARDTDELLELGRAKLARKACDLLVVNDVSAGAVFGESGNAGAILSAPGAAASVIPFGPKEVLAHRVWDSVAARLAGTL